MTEPLFPRVEYNPICMLCPACVLSATYLPVRVLTPPPELSVLDALLIFPKAQLISDPIPPFLYGFVGNCWGLRHHISRMIEIPVMPKSCGEIPGFSIMRFLEGLGL